MLSKSEYRFLPLRQVPLAEGTKRLYDRWIAQLDEELSDPSTDRNEFCRRLLTEIYFPADRRRSQLATPRLAWPPACCWTRWTLGRSRWSPSTTPRPTWTATTGRSR